MTNRDAPIIHKTNGIVSLSVARQSRDEAIETKWLRFVEAQNKSKQTLAVADGIAAGKAYAEFLACFTRRPS